MSIQLLQLLHQLLIDIITACKGRVTLDVASCLNEEQNVKVVYLEELRLVLKQSVETLLYQELALFVASEPWITRVRPQQYHNVLLLHCGKALDETFIRCELLEKLEHLLIGVGEVDAGTHPHQIDNRLKLETIASVDNYSEQEVHELVRELAQRLLAALSKEALQDCFVLVILDATNALAQLAL